MKYHYKENILIIDQNNEFDRIQLLDKYVFDVSLLIGLVLLLIASIFGTDFKEVSFDLMLILMISGSQIIFYYLIIFLQSKMEVSRSTRKYSLQVFITLFLFICLFFLDAPAKNTSDIYLVSIVSISIIFLVILRRSMKQAKFEEIQTLVDMNKVFINGRGSLIGIESKWKHEIFSDMINIMIVKENKIIPKNISRNEIENDINQSISKKYIYSLFILKNKNGNINKLFIGRSSNAIVIREIINEISSKIRITDDLL